MHKWLILWHKYLGLCLGLLLSLVGLSGSLLVFDHALDEALWPKTLSQTSEVRHTSFGKVLENARLAAAVFANDQGVDADWRQAQRIDLSRKIGSPHVVRFSQATGMTGPLEVSVAPSSGEVLATRVWGSYTMSWFYRLHYTLLAGKTGMYVVGSSGLVLIFFCLSGLFIWWPRNGLFKKALSVRRDAGRYRFYSGLHKVLGVHFSLILLLIAFTGVAMVFYTPVKTLVSHTLPFEPKSKVQVAVPPQSYEMWTVDEVIKKGRSFFPHAELKRVYLATSENAAYRLRYRHKDAPWSNHSESDVWIHAYSGDVLIMNDLFQAPVGNQLLAWLFPLHNGDALGLWGRWLILLSGFLPGFLFVSGFYMWWKKQR